MLQQGNLLNNNYQKFNTARGEHYFYSFDTVQCKCKVLTIKTSNSKTLSIKSSCDFYSNLFFLLTAVSDRTKYLLQQGNCVLGLTKSIRYKGDFVIAGFVSTYFTVILPGFQMFFIITGSLL